MKKIEQIVVKRESHKRDEGTMGFHDYVMVKEDLAIVTGKQIGRAHV